MLRLDELPFGQDRRALDDVAQLADVAGPRVALEDVHRLLIDGANRLAVAGVELVEECLHEERDVLASVAQRRQLDGEDVEPVVTGPRAACRCCTASGGIDVGGGDHAHVNGLFLPSAEAPERPLLQHAQQLDLRRGHHLGDLVEEQRAAMRQLEARPCADRARR